MTEELWVKGICEDVGHLLSQVNWEDLDCDRLQLDSEVMILEGDVLCLGAHPGRRGKGNGPIVVLVYMGRLEGRLQDLGMFWFEPQDISYISHQGELNNDLTHGSWEINVLCLGGIEGYLRLEYAWPYKPVASIEYDVSSPWKDERGVFCFPLRPLARKVSVYMTLNAALGVGLQDDVFLIFNL